MTFLALPSASVEGAGLGSLRFLDTFDVAEEEDGGGGVALALAAALRLALSIAIFSHFFVSIAAVSLVSAMSEWMKGSCKRREGEKLRRQRCWSALHLTPLLAIDCIDLATWVKLYDEGDSLSSKTSLSEMPLMYLPIPFCFLSVLRSTGSFASTCLSRHTEGGPSSRVRWWQMAAESVG